jgi:hypothetical protein
VVVEINMVAEVVVERLPLVLPQSEMLVATAAMALHL